MTKPNPKANPHASALGSIKTEKRTAAARANLKRAHAARRAKTVCTCRVARLDGTHESRCRLQINEQRRQRYQAQE